MDRHLRALRGPVDFVSADVCKVYEIGCNLQKCEGLERFLLNVGLKYIFEYGSKQSDNVIFES